ncbi:MAG: acyl-CoA dehydrogenase family protein, partial [Chloroflexi bacterium]
MNFELGHELEAFQGRVRQAVSELVAPQARSADEEGGFRREVVDALVATGLPAWALEHGPPALAVFYEELGHADS